MSHQKGWKIITQRSHGLLAAMIAYPHNIDLPNDMLVPILVAIAEHDDGIAESLDDKNLTDAGAPRHFLVNKTTVALDLEQYQQLMELATAKCQLNALLTSMHIDFVVGLSDEPLNQGMSDFLKAQQKHRKALLKDLNISKKQSEVLYRFVEWCDAFSLLICMDRIQPEGRKMEISEGPDGVMNQTYYKEDGVITVTPWIFRSDSFKVFYEYRIVAQLKFESIEEFNEVYKDAPVERAEYLISK